MAVTDIQIRNLFNHSQLTIRVEAAVIAAADKVRLESDTTANHANRMAWAQAALRNPQEAARSALNAFLTAMRTAEDLPAITGATTTIIEQHVDAAIDVMAGI